MCVAPTTTSWVVRLSAAVLTLAVLGCQSQATVASQQDLNRRYQTLVRMLQDARPAPLPLVPAEQAWTLRLGAVPSGPGALDDLRLYVPLREELIVALDRETGRLAWTRDIASAAPIAASGGRLFVAARGALTAFDASDGREVWSAALDAAVTGRLVSNERWVIAVVEPGEALAFHAHDGRLAWRHALGAATAHAAVPGPDGVLYFSLLDGRLVALQSATGDMLWERKLPGTLSEPAAARDRVFVGSTDNFFYALDARTGRDRWKWRNGGDVIGAAVDGDVVYFASLDNIMRAVNLSNGNQRWRKPTGTRPVLPPFALRGIVVLPGVMPAVTVFVGATGEVMGTHSAQGDLAGPPLIDVAPRPWRVAIVTVTREGVVEALRPSGLLFREAATAPVAALPGRPLSREPADRAPGT